VIKSKEKTQSLGEENTDKTACESVQGWGKNERRDKGS
jgi:hypothetical protein